MSSQHFCLKWNNHLNNMMDVFKNLLSTESMVDCTLACDGLSLKAHKMVLSACSPFFQSLFLENPCKHPIVILKDMKYTELKAIIEFMYHGEVNVAQDQLSALMKTAETLRVKGLAEVTNDKNSSAQDEPTHRSVPRAESPPLSRKPNRRRVRKRSLSDSNRSDESNEPKIKQPPSPDIEELSGDVTMDNSSQFSNIQSHVPMQSTPSHSTNSYHRSSSIVTQDPQIEEPASADESEFGVEPAKLLEQTLTTDDLNARRSRSALQSMEMQRRPRSSTDHSNILPSSMPSEALSSNTQPDSPPDIKPELLDLDPPMSPVAGPSHSGDNSMMMYMDQSSVSSHPGTSFQDSTALVPQDAQPQEAAAKIRIIYFDEDGEQITAEQVQVITVQDETKSKDKEVSRKTVESEVDAAVSELFKTGDLHEPQKSEDEATKQLARAARKRGLTVRKVRAAAKSDPRYKKFECHLCSFTCHCKSRLDIHLRTHTGERPFPCDECSKSFRRAYDLKVHSLIHTKVRPHACNICGDTYNNKSNLRRHIKRHESRAFPCLDCPEVFDNRDLYRDHVNKEHRSKSKASFICETCGKFIKGSYDFRLHALTHSDDKPYKCKFCEMAFNHPSSRKRHVVKMHTVEKFGEDVPLPRHVCEYCSQSFKLRDSLVKHYKKKHPGTWIKGKKSVESVGKALEA